MKIGVIGCGSIGKRHIRNLKQIFADSQDGSEVIAFDVSEEALKFVSTEYEVRTTTDLDALLKEVEGVFVCTPNHLHASLGLKAVQNDCHVLIEKPLAHSMEHVEEMLSIAKQKGLTVTVGYMLRYYEPLQKVKNIIDSGALGKIYGAYVESAYYLPYWRPTQDYRKNYGAIKAQGGGIILDSIHDINYINWLLGKPLKVFSFADKISNLEINTEDYANIEIYYEGGVVAHVHLDYLQKSYSRGCKIVGEKGTVIWNFKDHVVKHYDDETKKWNIITIENFDFNTTYIAEEKHFLKCVAKEAEPVVSSQEAKVDLCVALAALKSAQTHECVRL